MGSAASSPVTGGGSGGGSGGGQARSPALPPGPALPRSVQTAIWMRRAQELMRRCQARYGDVFTVRMAYRDTVVVFAHPGAVKQIFTGDPAVLHAGEANVVALPVLGPHSVLLLDGAAHTEQRKLLLPPFSGRRLQRYDAMMARAAAAEIERWPLGRPCRMRPRMQALTLEIIIRAVFGVQDDHSLQRLRAALRRLLVYVTDPRRVALFVLLGVERLPRFRPFRRELERVDRLIHEEIAARRAVGDLAAREDILSLLLAARHEDGQPMSAAELRDELVTMLVAGHETTATALAWAVERLARHPEKLERLAAEVETGEDAYLKAVVCETLRLRPVVSIVGRRLTEPLEIGGWLLPAGVTAAPSIYLLHRRPDLYHSPERFLPERFEEQPPAPFTWIPFGGGARYCLGAGFAQLELRVVLRELVRRRTLRPARSRAERSYRRAIIEAPRRDAEVVLGSRA